MGKPEVVKMFLESESSGFYLRVVEEGELAAGDPIELVQTDPERVTVHSINHLRFLDKGNRDAIAKALRAEALAPSWREDFEGILERAG